MNKHSFGRLLPKLKRENLSSYINQRISLFFSLFFFLHSKTIIIIIIVDILPTKKNCNRLLLFIFMRVLKLFIFLRTSIVYFRYYLKLKLKATMKNFMFFLHLFKLSWNVKIYLRRRKKTTIYDLCESLILIMRKKVWD